MNKQTSINIDFIRILLCVVVIIAHVLDLLEIKNIFNTNIDFYAVWTFFVLSGYVNWESIKRNSNGFFKRRLKRLLPKYYIALAISFIIWILTNDINSKDLIEFIHSTFMIQHILGTQAPITNIALWSLSYEFLFYGILSMFFIRKGIGIALIIISAFFGLLNEYVLMLGSAFVIGILLNHLKIELDFVKLKEIKISKYTYEIYIFHFPLMYLIFYLIF